jgi:hypothetical protein
MYTAINNLISAYDSLSADLLNSPFSFILAGQSLYSDLSKYMVIGLTALIILGAGISVYKLFNSLVTKREQEINNTHTNSNK